MFSFFYFYRDKKRAQEAQNTSSAKKSKAKRKLESSCEEKIKPNLEFKMKSCKVILFRENFDDIRTTSNSKLKVKTDSMPKIVSNSKARSNRTSISLRSSKDKKKQNKLSTEARNSKSASQKDGKNPPTELSSEQRMRLKCRTTLHELMIMKPMLKCSDDVNRIALKEMDGSIEDFIVVTENQLFEKFNTELQYTMVQRKLVKILEKDTTALCKKITNGTIYPKKLIEMLCSNELKEFLSGNKCSSDIKGSSSTSSCNKSSGMKNKPISWTTTASPKKKRKQAHKTFFNPLDLLPEFYKRTSDRLNTSDGVQIQIPIETKL